VSKSSGPPGPSPFAAVIRARRLAAGLTQTELASRAGLSLGAIRDLEQGRTTGPRPGSLARLAAVLELGPEDQAPARPPEVAVLGPLTAWHHGVTLDLGPVRQRAVLGLLVVHHGTGLSREAIIDALWEERPPPTAVDMVQGYVSRLRRLLGPGEVLRWDGGRYQLATSSVRCDVADFEQLAARARHRAADGGPAEAYALYEEALRLWRGRPLADLDLLRAHPAVTDLSRHRVAVVLEYADVAAAAGCPERPLPALQAVADLELLDERVQARLMTALAAAGQQAAALACYEAVRARLERELGVDPGPELAAVRLGILRQTVPRSAAPQPVAADQGRSTEPEPVVPRQLPPASAQFAGRAAELAELDELLDRAAQAAGAVTVVSASGPAGAGKTALAVHWAHRVADRFPDGQLFLDLGGYGPDRDPLRPAEAQRLFLEALQVPEDQIPVSPQARTGRYRSMLAGRQLLIVLDNAKDAAQVRPLLPGGSRCLVIVTSRDQLAGLTVAQGAHPVVLDVLTFADAHALLGRRLGPGQLADPGSVAELIGLCARLPLALSVAAARAAEHPAFPLGTTVAELRDERSRLEVLGTGEAASDVRAVLSWSYERLSPPAALMFRLLSVHPGPDVTAPAAASVSGLAPAEARRALTELTRRSMLTEHAPGRYAGHDLLRAYAAESARAADGEAGLDAALRRTLDHYLRACQRVSRLLYPAWPQLGQVQDGPAEPVADLEQALAWIEAERLVLLASVARAAAAGCDEQVWQFSWFLELVLYRRSGWHDLLMIQQAALTAATRLGHRTRQAHALRSLGLAQAMTDSPGQGTAQITQALRIFREAGDDFDRGFAHECMAYALARHGRPRDALGHARKARKFYRAADYHVGLASALNNIACFHAELGDQAQALSYSRRSVRAFRGLSDSRGEAIALGSLARVYHKLGQQAEALDCYRQALAAIGPLGDRHSQADIRTHLGDTYHALGDDKAARQAWTEALSVYAEQNPVQARQLLARIDNLSRAN
jgi:DNA-binding SARP family transcriptional activator/tetratricopeptide (TPR) repeat protein